MARQGTRIRAGNRMQAAWSSVMVETRAVGSSGATLGATSVGETATGRLTIARVRGSAYCHLDAGAALDSMQVALGLIVVKEEAFTVGGVTAMPGPQTDIEQSWLWHHIFTLGPAVSATDDGGDISRNSRIVIDSKAQRKIQTGDTLAFVWESTVLAGTPTFDGQAAVRTMFLLP